MLCCIELGGELYLPKKDCWLAGEKKGPVARKKKNPASNREISLLNSPFTAKLKSILEIKGL